MQGTTGLRVGPGEFRSIERDVEAWDAELRRKRRSKDYLERGPTMIRELAARFGWTSSAQATPAQLSLWLADKGGSGHTQNNRVSIIRAYFRHCLKTLKTVTVNPATDLERADDSKGDGVREFTAGEMADLFKAATGHWKTAVGILATTALRRGAVFRGIRCGWFDEVRQVLVLPAGFLKNRKAQTIPLNEDAMMVLADACRGRAPDEFIVPIRPDARAWDRLIHDARIARKDARGRPCGMHSFRKGVLTNLAELGVHPKVAQDLAGHSDIRLTMGVYTRINLESQAAALKKLPRLTPHQTGVSVQPTEKVAGGAVDKIEETSDSDNADSIGVPMVSLAQPGPKARLSADSTVDQQSPASASLGRAFQSGSPSKNPVRHEVHGDSSALSGLDSMGRRGFEPRMPLDGSEPTIPTHPTQPSVSGFQPSSESSGRGARGCPATAPSCAHESPEARSPDSVVLDALASVPPHHRRTLLLQLLALVPVVAVAAALVWLAVRAVSPAEPAPIADTPSTLP